MTVTKKEKTLYMELSRDNDKKQAYINNELQLQTESLSLKNQNKSLSSATNILSRSPMA